MRIHTQAVLSGQDRAVQARNRKYPNERVKALDLIARDLRETHTKKRNRYFKQRARRKQQSTELGKAANDLFKLLDLGVNPPRQSPLGAGFDFKKTRRHRR